jgi:hypothetical protein
MTPICCHRCELWCCFIFKLEGTQRLLPPFKGEHLEHAHTPFKQCKTKRRSKSYLQHIVGGASFLIFCLQSVTKPHWICPAPSAPSQRNSKLGGFYFTIHLLNYEKNQLRMKTNPRSGWIWKFYLSHPDPLQFSTLAEKEDCYTPKHFPLAWHKI